MLYFSIKKLKVILFIISIGFTSLLSAQDTTQVDRKDAINVFFDCMYCDQEFIKDKLQLVNYVRDRKDADVHIMVSSESTGSGGVMYTWFFLGQNSFVNYNDTLTIATKSDVTSDERREKHLRTMQIGLIPFISKTSLINDVDIEFKTLDNMDGKIVEDKWNSWVYGVNVRGFFNGEESYQNLFGIASASAVKVTPNIKLEFEFDYVFEKEVYLIEEDGVPEELRFTSSDMSFEHLFVKSINDHWSWGYDMDVRSSTYQNIEIGVSVYPSIEYNLFPYEESNRRQLRFLYGMGYKYNDYLDTTLYNKLEEGHLHQRLTVAYEVQEKWGSIETSIRASNYFHDFGFNNVRLYSSLRLRLFKGFSVSLSGSFAMIHDQLSLVKEDVSSEDILLHQKEIATQYNYWGSVGISYTFGSIYNNVVNPRFGN